MLEGCQLVIVPEKLHIFKWCIRRRDMEVAWQGQYINKGKTPNWLVSWSLLERPVACCILLKERSPEDLQGQDALEMPLYQMEGLYV